MDIFQFLFYSDKFRTTYITPHKISKCLDHHNNLLISIHVCDPFYRLQGVIDKVRVDLHPERVQFCLLQQDLLLICGLY